MASLRLYGAHSASTERMLASQGANIEHGAAPDPSVLQRALEHRLIDQIIDLDLAGLTSDPQGLSELLERNPDALLEPLVVRGNSFMVSRDPSRLQSLMY